MESKSNQNSVCNCDKNKQNVNSKGVQLRKDDKSWNKFCMCSKRTCPPVKPKCIGNLVKFTVKLIKTSMSKTSASKTSVSKPAASKTSVSKPAASKISASKTSVSKPAASKTSVSKPALSKTSVSKPAVNKTSVSKTPASKFLKNLKFYKCS